MCEGCSKNSRTLSINLDFIYLGSIRPRPLRSSFLHSKYTPPSMFYSLEALLECIFQIFGKFLGSLLIFMVCHSTAFCTDRQSLSSDIKVKNILALLPCYVARCRNYVVRRSSRTHRGNSATYLIAEYHRGRLQSTPLGKLCTDASA